MSLLTGALPVTTILAFLTLTGGVLSKADNASPERAPTVDYPWNTASDIVYIENGQIRMGFKKSSGAGIASFALSRDGENIINHWDRGRLVQQSYYGKEDGSTWTLDGKVIPWRWNPVQGGDCRNNPARVLDLKRTQDSFYSKSMGRNWGGCQDLEDVIFEQWVTLDGPVAHVKFRMSYNGKTTHPAHTQELPAVFIEPKFDTLLVYDGNAPWTSAPVTRSIPGWPNESRSIKENWAAYVNDAGTGIGVYAPIADRLTCYRYGSGKHRREDGACSYFAPIKKFAITPGMVFTYDMYMTIGSAEEIRARFYKAHEKTR